MLNRRSALMLFSGALATPKTALAATPKEITWDDLLPVGVPYSEIIGEGELDEVNDTWNPIYDENATKLNESLDGSYIKMPGFIIPFDIGVKGVTEFMLVPYTGACIHMPPPPANQLVMVNAKTPWPSDDLWNPFWVIGMMRMQLQTTDFGQTGYAIVADQMEVYEW